MSMSLFNFTKPFSSPLLILGKVEVLLQLDLDAAAEALDFVQANTLVPYFGQLARVDL